MQRVKYPSKSNLPFLSQETRLYEEDEAELERAPSELELKELTRAESLAAVEVLEQLSQFRRDPPSLLIVTLYLMQRLKLEIDLYYPVYNAARK